MNKHFEVTEEQLAATTRHTDENGQAFYTVKSASDPTGEGFYTVRWNPQYKVPSDNCKSGRAGECCWHKRASLVAEARFQAEALAARTPQEISEQAQIQSYVGQGVDLATATRIVYAKPATSTARGSLNGNQGFSLMR